jgi:hypothetical protein
MEIIMTQNNRKSFKYSVYGILTASAVIFWSSYQSKASWIFEEGEKFFQRNIVRPVENATEDTRTALKRSIRPNSNNSLENVLQSIGDRLEDTWKIIKRKVVFPVKDLLEDWKL